MRRSLIAVIALSTVAGSAFSQTEYNLKHESTEFVQGFGRVDGILFGGMSGIDYDPQSKFWYTVSKDAGESAPVRFFAMDIRFDEYGHLNFTSDEVQLLNHPDGTLIEAGTHTPSSVRIIPPDPIGDEPYLVWTSEGVLKDGNKAGVFEMCTGASFMDGFEIAEYTDFVPDAGGPRVDMAYESIALLPNMEIIAGFEQALVQDGPIAKTGSGTTYARLLHLDYFKANQIGEMAYPLEEPDADEGEGAVRSLVDLVAVDEGTLLAIENIEVPATGRIRDVTTELYLVELGGATDIMGTESLANLVAGTDFVPVTKTFLGDNESMGELRRVPFRGMTFGPMFEDGRASIILISDNDCDQYQNTYIALLSIENIQPRRPFVKEGGRAYEARDIDSVQATPERFRIIREQKKKAGEETPQLGSG
ncbi:MAG: hypothetical protein COB69_00455 [Phycisphaera sp.]|nr:MAG: hypothetical protein COB69_00455 [Phycisphaera sp.]